MDNPMLEPCKRLHYGTLGKDLPDLCATHMKPKGNLPCQPRGTEWMVAYSMTQWGQQHASTSPTKEGRMSKRSRKRRDRKKKGANHGKKPNA